MHVESLGKARYFIEFIDDSSRWCEVRFLKSKSEVLKVTKEYVAMLENQQGIKVKCPIMGASTPAMISMNIWKKEGLED